MINLPCVTNKFTDYLMDRRSKLSYQLQLDPSDDGAGVSKDEVLHSGLTSFHPV